MAKCNTLRDPRFCYRSSRTWHAILQDETRQENKVDKHHLPDFRSWGRSEHSIGPPCRPLKHVQFEPDMLKMQHFDGHAFEHLASGTECRSRSPFWHCCLPMGTYTNRWRSSYDISECEVRPIGMSTHKNVTWCDSSVGLSGLETSNQTFTDIQFTNLALDPLATGFSWFLPALVPHSNSGFLWSQWRVDFEAFCSLFPSAWCSRWASQQIMGDLRFWNARQFGWKFQ